MIEVVKTHCMSGPNGKKRTINENDDDDDVLYLPHSVSYRKTKSCRIPATCPPAK